MVFLFVLTVIIIGCSFLKNATPILIFILAAIAGYALYSACHIKAIALGYSSSEAATYAKNTIFATALICGFCARLAGLIWMVLLIGLLTAAATGLFFPMPAMPYWHPLGLAILLAACTLTILYKRLEVVLTAAGFVLGFFFMKYGATIPMEIFSKMVVSFPLWGGIILLVLSGRSTSHEDELESIGLGLIACFVIVGYYTLV